MYVYPIECTMASTVATLAIHLWNILNVPKFQPVSQRNTSFRPAKTHRRGKFATARIPVRSVT